MKTRSSILATSLVLAFAMQMPAAQAATEHRHAREEAAQQLRLNAGKKWASDEHLRQAMGDINRAMGKALPLIHEDRFGPAEYGSLAATVNEKVAYAVANCKLEPQADAVLHVIIGELTAAADTMAGKTAKPRHDGAVQVLEALKAYGEYFSHPGWKAAGA